MICINTIITPLIYFVSFYRILISGTDSILSLPNLLAPAARIDILRRFHAADAAGKVELIGRFEA